MDRRKDRPRTVTEAKAKLRLAGDLGLSQLVAQHPLSSVTAAFTIGLVLARFTGVSKGLLGLLAKILMA